MIIKSIKYAAPYSSETFNSDKDIFIGINGVVSGGAVTTSSGVVTIQPLTWCQEGQFITSTDALSAPLPPNLEAPYFVAVSSSSQAQTPSEVITPTFVQRPEDVSTATVLVAEWDGQEWRPLPLIQIDAIIQAIQNQQVKQNLTGVAGGLDVSVAGSNIVAQAGSVIDPQGRLTIKLDEATFPLIAEDADSFGRVDRLIYRRPDDSPSRTGIIDYLPGRTYVSGSAFENIHQTVLGNGTSVEQAVKTLNDSSDNATYFLYLQDYGVRGTICFQSVPDAMTPLSAAVTVATNVSCFDAVLNDQGNIDVIYARGNNLYAAQISTSGASIIAETLVASGSTSIASVKAVSIPAGASYYTHTVFERVISTAVHTLQYARLSPNYTAATPELTLVNLSTVTTHPSIDKDDNDSLLFLAYENSSTGLCYLRTYDVSTATQNAAPTLLGGTLELENDSLILDSGVVVSGGASYPIVKRQANKDTLVFFLQNKGSATGVAVYSPRYLAAFGHKAIIVDLQESGENVASFSVDIDNIGFAHFQAYISPNLIKSSVDLQTGLSDDSIGVISSSNPNFTETVFTSRGALVLVNSAAGTGFQDNGGTEAIQYFGPGLFSGVESVDASEFVMLASDYASLPTAPTLGDQVVITAASDNNGSYSFSQVRTFAVAGTNYVAVTAQGAAFDNTISSGTVQFQTQSASVFQFSKGTAGLFSNLRTFEVLPTDLGLAQYRSEDGTLAVANPATETNLSLQRLFEFQRVIVVGGNPVTWNTSNHPNVLKNAADFNIRFFNRQGVYTIPANLTGVTINEGQVAYVAIPDEDESTNLSLQVTELGDGILDRHGRDIYVMFWNNGGVLCTFFLFQQLAAGSTTDIGLFGDGEGNGNSNGVLNIAQGFQYGIQDVFSVEPTDPTSYVDNANTTGSYENGVAPAQGLYQLDCDKTVTITTTGTAFTLSAAPNFTITENCIIWSNSLQQFRKIASLSSQTAGTLDAAFSSNLAADTGQVSQAVFTNDLTAMGNALHHQRAEDIFPGAPMPAINVDYRDSVAANDGYFDSTVEATVVVSACNSGNQADASVPTSDEFESPFSRVPTVASDGQLPVVPIYNLPLPPSTATINSTPYSQPNTSLSGQGVPIDGAHVQIAVPFVVSETTTLSDATVYLFLNSGAPTGNILVQLLNDGGENPGSTTIASGAIPAADVTATSATPFTVALTGVLSPGRYWLNVTGDSTYQSGVASSNSVSIAFSPGTSTVSVFNGASWVQNQGYALGIQGSVNGSATGPASVTLYSQTTNSSSLGFSGANGGGVSAYASAFSVESANTSIVSAKVFLQKFSSSSIAGNVLVQICQDNKGVPGSIVVSASIPATSIPNTLTSYTVSFSENSLDVGNYWLVLTADADLLSSENLISTQQSAVAPNYSPLSVYTNPDFPNFTGTTPEDCISAVITAYVNATVPGAQRLFLAFFPNPNNAAVTTQANLIGYTASLYPQETLLNGGLLNSAYGMSDGSGTPLNCTIDVDATSNRTRVTLTNWSYTPGLNMFPVQQTNGGIKVKLEGKSIPRYFLGVVGAYYLETSPTTVEVYTNLSGVSVSIEVSQEEGQIDNTDQNAAYISGRCGMIEAFGGAIPPAGYLPCDGSAVSRSLYSTLFATIGTAWGSGDGSTTFNVPDLRGRFIRGIDDGAGNDPDSATRTASNAGGNTGDAVGSVQEDQFGSHLHQYYVNEVANAVPSGSGGTGVQGNPSNTSSAGGSETRPKNAYVNFVIQY